ncbi:MAG: hypothetical protein ACREKM_13445 [Longimicrobiales bacterium]
MRRIAFAMLVGLPIVAAACGQGQDTAADAGDVGVDTAAAAVTATDTSGAAGLIPGTPPGDLADWVEDIRTGLEPVPEQAAQDRALAQRTALDLYIGRQEYLELYYGVAGRLKASDALADAIVADELAFHRILELVNPASTETVTPELIRAAIDTLNVRLDVVLQEAEAAGVGELRTE